MLDELVIVNLRPDCADAVPSALANVQWHTCLRRILFLHRTEVPFLRSQKGFEIYYGRDAYQFLLEVICGLHSPLVGENAVMGQFRKFRASARFPNTAWGRFLRTTITDLLVDARYVRHHHLQGLGSQSYGSLLRRHLKGQTNVAVVGAGSLAHEIVPWLTNVRVFYRNWQHARDLVGEHPHIRVDQFSMSDAGWEAQTASLIIAAPINSADLNRWLALQNVCFSSIFDLRGDAATDPIDPTLPVITLPELLSALCSEREKIDHRVIGARSEIEALASQRAHQAYPASTGLGLCA